MTMMSVRETADTLGVELPTFPRGRHAASEGSRIAVRDELSVGAICLIYGQPAPVRTGQYVTGRHAFMDDATATIVVNLF